MNSSSRAAQFRQQTAYSFQLPYYFIFAALGAIILYFLLVLGCWKIFKKAGEKGWKAIIPFYNVYILYKLFWKRIWFLPFFIFSLVFIVSSVSLMLNLWSTQILTISLIGSVQLLLILKVVYMIKLSKAFGKNDLFTVCLVVLDFVFMLILGFGSSKYVLLDEDHFNEKIVKPIKEPKKSKKESVKTKKTSKSKKSENLQKSSKVKTIKSRDSKKENEKAALNPENEANNYDFVSFQDAVVF